MSRPAKLVIRVQSSTLQITPGDHPPHSRAKPPLHLKKSTDDLDLADCRTTARSRTPSISDCSRMLGIVTSETSAYFILKSMEKWIPVTKRYVMTEEGSVLPLNTRLEAIKGHKAWIYTRKGEPVKAFLTSSGETDYQSTEEASPETEVNNGETVEHMAKMTRKLLSDLTAITHYCRRPGADPQRIARFLSARQPCYRKNSVRVLNDLESSKSRSVSRSAQEIRQLLGNIPGPEETHLTCDWCKQSKSAIVLSCGHRVCKPCATSASRCMSCKSQLSNTDLKLLHFEGYKRGRRTSSTCG